jgi:DNA-binding NtrC family response regulator
MRDAIQKNKFREDLYYRLSTVEIHLPPLRNRKEDSPLLFRKFAADFAQKYRMPTLRLDEQAQELLVQYNWNGNIRQLRNVAEQISVLEQDRLLSANSLRPYLPNMGAQLPALVGGKKDQSDFASEREILYKVLFDMKSDLNDLKKLTLELMNQDISKEEKEGLIQKIYGNDTIDNKEENILTVFNPKHELQNDTPIVHPQDNYSYAETIEAEEPLSLLEKEIEMIKKALERSNGKRKLAAEELGISERTLYRKIKQYDLNEDEI